jgi:hypothetical protein
MYDLIDQCHQWNKSSNSNNNHHQNTNMMINMNNTNNPLHQPMEDYTDGFWKVFLLNDKIGGCSHDYSSGSESKNEGNGGGVATCHCMKHTKTARRRRFKSQSGYYLSIMPNGQILGVKDSNSPYINIDVIPVGADLVKIWGVEAELFLMIDDQGQMRGTDVDSAECIFEETLTENFFNVYYSAMYLHKRWCVGLRNKQQSRSFYRKPKPAKDTSFMIEIVRRRSSTSSVCDSDDSSRVSSL